TTGFQAFSKEFGIFGGVFACHGRLLRVVLRSCDRCIIKYECLTIILSINPRTSTKGGLSALLCIVYCQTMSSTTYIMIGEIHGSCHACIAKPDIAQRACRRLDARGYPERCFRARAETRRAGTMRTAG